MYTFWYVSISVVEAKAPEAREVIQVMRLLPFSFKKLDAMLVNHAWCPSQYHCNNYNVVLVLDKLVSCSSLSYLELFYLRRASCFC